MSRSLAKLFSSAVVLGSVFSRYKQRPRHKTGNELNVQFQQQTVKRILLVAIRMVVLSARSHCLIKVRGTKSFV